MLPIEGILFEPVGCLAEFPPEPFHEIAAQLFRRRKQHSKSGSRSYWHLLNLMEASAFECSGILQNRDRQGADRSGNMAEALEVQAVEDASIYEDVIPALSDLKAMGIKLFIASSLSGAAIARFLEKFCLDEFFSETWSRDNAGGVKAAPLRAAIVGAPLKPEHAMFLTDTAEGLKTAKSVGVNSILMMNDPDEAMRLALHDPAGGIVSLHELPDFVRLVAAENTTQSVIINP